MTCISVKCSSFLVKSVLPDQKMLATQQMAMTNAMLGASPGLSAARTTICTYACRSLTASN